MDPDKARLVLTTAALVDMHIGFATSAVHELSAQELKNLKNYQVPPATQQVAKKYHKIMELGPRARGRT